MLKNNLHIFILAYLFAIPYCRAADDPRPTKRRCFGIQQQTLRVEPLEQQASLTMQHESSWDRALEQKGLSLDAIRNYRMLNFSDRQITAIPNTLDLPKLKILDLEKNKIQAIPVNLHLPALKELHLNDNQITAIPNQLNLPDLQELNLDDNQITAIPNQLNLPALRWLYLNNNKIEDIPTNLDHLSLEELHLNDNQITTIPNKLNLPALRSLSLNGNQITTIPANLDIPALTTLYLSNNKIGFIPAELKLANLRWLKLNTNRIDHIEAKIFLDQFPCLEYLNLSENPIDSQNIKELRKAAEEQHRTITIVANNIGRQYAQTARLQAGFNRGARIKKAVSTFKPENE